MPKLTNTHISIINLQIFLLIFLLHLTPTDAVDCTTIAECQTCVVITVCNQCNLGFGLVTSNNNISCQCNFYKCSSCVDGPFCDQCQDGYFLQNPAKLCLPCWYPCITCTSTASTCASCPDDNTYFLSTGTCLPCSSGNLSNCATCNQLGDICYTCNSTQYFVDNNTCSSCVAPCLTCNATDTCFSCVDMTTKYNQTTNKCDSCSDLIPNCTECITANVCLECNTTFTLYLTYPPNSCVQCTAVHPACLNCSQSSSGPLCTSCSDKYFLGNDSKCYSCPEQCSLCSDYDTCTQCVNQSYVLQNTTCTACSAFSTDCLECEMAGADTKCLKCTNNKIAITGIAPDYCQNCNQTQYANSTSTPQQCVQCTEPCLSCLNDLDCTACVKYYRVNKNSKRCVDICGDRVVMTADCDNGYGVKNDGCSNTCTQQSNYTCVVNPVTLPDNTKVNKSICSYGLELEIQLQTVTKADFENYITFTFLVYPYLYGLPGTTSRQFSAEDLKNIFKLVDLTPRNTSSARNLQGGNGTYADVVTVNAEAGLVSCSLIYQYDVYADDFQLTVDIAYLRDPLGQIYFASTPPTSSAQVKLSDYMPESLIGHYFTDDQYSNANLLYVISMMIAILSFVAFLIGIFTKEVVGLEMAMLCQFAYISLFYFQGIMQLPYYALYSLWISTGYNIKDDTIDYSLSASNPPQARVLGIDATTFSDNFNLMAILYIIPLIAVIPFIPLKAKCIRRLSTIELGHKWVDLLLGQIYLYIVLFNYQYFLVCAIIYYQDGRNTKNYSSTMIIWFVGLATICSFAGLIFKPQIYGNFRTVFRYNDQLRTDILNKKLQRQAFEEKLTMKFEGEKKCTFCKGCWEKVAVFINESIFWQNFRNCHSTFTYNHYNIIILYFTLSTIFLTFIQDSSIIIVALSAVLMIEVFILRPYGQISEKLRGIYFSFCLVVISLVRYFNNHLLDGQYNTMLPLCIVGLLGIAIIWTYITLIKYFYTLIVAMMSDRNVIVTKVFNKEIDSGFKKHGGSVEEEEALMRKLMKRYQRIELQYNFNDARDQLLKDYDSGGQDKKKLLSEEIQMVPVQGKKLQPEKDQTNSKEQKIGKHASVKKPVDKKQNIEGQNINQASKQANQNKQQPKYIDIERVHGEGNLGQQQEVVEPEENFKNLKEQLERAKKKKKRQELSKKVYGSKMMKMLYLDNFDKYEQQYLAQGTDNSKLGEQQKKLMKAESKSKWEESQQDEKSEDKKEEVQIQQSQHVSEFSYQSVEPQNLQQAKEKIDEQKIIMEENQHLRYQRAMKMLSQHGLNLDKNLIEDHYQNI